MAFGYYVDGDGNYYEGEKLDPSWTAVTQRASFLQDWNGASWVYSLTRTRAFQKSKFTDDLEADLAAAMSSAGLGLMDIAAIALGVYECTKLGDDPAATDQEVPLLYGVSLYNSSTKADAASLISSTVQTFAAYIGKMYAYKIETFDAIDASTNAIDILNMEYVRPL